MSPTSPGIARTAAWLGLLGAAGGVLHLMGGGELAAPPLGSLDQLGSWARGDAPTSAVALVRLGAELTVWYLLALSLLQLAATRARAGGVDRVARAVAVPGSRRLVHAGLGVGLLAATAAGADPEPDTPSTAWMRPHGEAPDDPPTPAPDDAPPGDPVPGDPATGDPATGDPTTAAMVPRPGPEVLAGPTTWRVDRGESFWSIAHDVLEQAWGRPPRDGEVDPYWRALVGHNRGRLVDPTDPDLILPGQVFELPAPPPEAERAIGAGPVP